VKWFLVIAKPPAIFFIDCAIAIPYNLRVQLAGSGTQDARKGANDRRKAKPDNGFRKEQPVKKRPPGRTGIGVPEVSLGCVETSVSLPAFSMKPGIIGIPANRRSCGR